MDEELNEIEKYKIEIEGIEVDVTIQLRKGDFVPEYDISILNISRGTNIILEKIRDEFVSKIQKGVIDIIGYENMDQMKEKFKKEVSILINKYITGISEKDKNVLTNYVIQQDIGLGNIEILLRDENLEEIVVNSSKDPVWAYHKKHGWLRTNIIIQNESKIRHYATMIAKDVGKSITILEPLLDAHLKKGDRVNATLNPISSYGNTITIRKFAAKPWTVTDMLKQNTISYEATAFIWLCIQNELSMLIAGGTASGKTSMLNAIASFFPPNQRIISIEDTREIVLPNCLHWVPMETRLPNPEGKGGVTMLDLVVNSLRMRPDRIVVGEIRRKQEAEVLFEAMHTGHSVYGTIHANNSEETIIRLTNPPIDIPKLVIPAMSVIIVQNRNRRNGKRRTLQIAEILSNGESKVLMQYDVNSDKIVKINESSSVYNTLKIYTGMSKQDIEKDMQEKIAVLKWLVENNITNINDLGLIFADYYTRGQFKK